VAANSLLVLNTALARQDSLARMPSTWRYWDDMALATDRYLAWRGDSRDQTPTPKKMSTIATVSQTP
jgi:hypothetical protein